MQNLTQNQTQQQTFPALEISSDQISTYLSCTLKYQLKYVLKHPAEHVRLAVPFGDALRKSLGYYYRQCAHRGVPRLSKLQDLFSEKLTQHLSETKNLIGFTTAMPDADSAITMGHGMLKAFYESIDLTGFEIFLIEFPVKAPLYTCKGLTDYRIVGTLDLLLKNPAGEIVIVNYEYAGRPKTQTEVDTDLQMTVSSLLLASQRRLVMPRSPLKGRFDVLRGPHRPTLEHYHTVRTEDDRKRLSKIAFKILAGIRAGVFYPNRGQRCTDCEYGKTCEGWHK
jgi:hypothetical protein